MKLRLYNSKSIGVRTTPPNIIVRGGSFREVDALGKCLGFLWQEGLKRIEYDPSFDVFFFRGRGRLLKDREEGFVLSVADAKAGACKTIFEPPKF